MSVIGQPTKKVWDPHRYIPAIDGLRAYAVMFVLLGHSYPTRFPGGGIGVDIFFAISGFLITSLLVAEFEKNNRINLLKFYARRALRLFPALYLLIFVSWFFLHPPLIHVLGIIFYFSNWIRVSGDNMSAYGHTWSLSVEEQFYIIWPFLIVISGFLCKGRKSFRGFVLLFSIIGCVVSLVLHFQGWDGERIYNGTDTRMVGLLGGAVASILVNKLSNLKNSTIFHILALTSGMVSLYYLICGIFVSGKFDAILLPIISTILVISLSHKNIKIVRFIFENKMVLYIGKISYGIYLWHYPLLYMIPTINPKPRIFIIFILSIIIASLSYFLVEKPLSKKIRPYISV